MLTVRVIPCLDVDAGRVVKGVRFQGMRDAGDPVELSLVYENQGADELVLLDVSATPEGRGSALHTVAAVRAKLGIPMTVGGGVRRTEDAGALLEAGADKVGANTAAVERPELLTEIATRFGSQCAVVSIDATRQGDGGWEVVTKSGKERTGKDAIAWAREATERGAGEILLTSWDRDGTRSGLRHRTAACRLGRRPRAGHCLGRSRPSRSSGRGDQSRRKCGARQPRSSTTATTPSATSNAPWSPPTYRPASKRIDEPKSFLLQIVYKCELAYQSGWRHTGRT